MKNSIFIADLQEEVGDLSEVLKINPKYETYEIELIEGKRFIVGKGKPDFLNKKEVTISGVDLLLSLVNLIKEDEEFPHYYNEPHMDPVISDDDVLKWVEKYGIPYKDRKLNEIYGDEIWRFDYLHLGHFKYRLAWLYTSFSLWKGLIEEDRQQIEKFKHAANTLLGWLKIEDEKINPGNPTSEIILIKKALAQSIGDKAHIQLGLRYHSDLDQNVFTLQANSLFDIAYYQLGSLMTKTPSDSKKSLKSCSSCHSLFWAKHKNSKYCHNPKCNRKNTYYHKNKDTKKTS